MSSVVKYNRVIIHEEKRILLDRGADLGTKSNPSIQIKSPNEDRQAQEAKRRAKKIIEKAKNKAEEMEVHAHKNAKDILEAAQQEGLEQGYNEGYELGFKEGQALGKKEYDNHIAQVKDLKQKYIEDYEKIYKASERDMLNLAIDIAKRVVGNLLEEQDETYLSLAYKALEYVKENRIIELRASNVDYPIVLKNKDFLLSKIEGIEDINIVEDSALNMGDCVIDTGNGIIDASAKTALEKIESSLLEIIEYNHS